MSIPLRIYVNERPFTLPPGSTVAAAVEAFDPTLADRVANGSAGVTDGRGLPLSLDAPLAGGAILRITGGGASQRTDAIP